MFKKNADKKSVNPNDNRANLGFEQTLWLAATIGCICT